MFHSLAVFHLIYRGEGKFSKLQWDGGLTFVCLWLNCKLRQCKLFPLLKVLTLKVPFQTKIRRVWGRGWREVFIHLWGGTKKLRTGKRLSIGQDSANFYLMEGVPQTLHNGKPCHWCISTSKKLTSDNNSFLSNLRLKKTQQI